MDYLHIYFSQEDLSKNILTVIVVRNLMISCIFCYLNRLRLQIDYKLRYKQPNLLTVLLN